MNERSVQAFAEVEEAGVYRLNCPLDDLRASAEDCGFSLFEANLADAHGKGEVLAELARAIAAPDWFGHNWDALADALGDLSWSRAPGYVSGAAWRMPRAKRC